MSRRRPFHQAFPDGEEEMRVNDEFHKDSVQARRAAFVKNPGLSSAQNKTLMYMVRLGSKDMHMRACYAAWTSLLVMEKKKNALVRYADKEAPVTLDQMKQAWIQVKVHLWHSWITQVQSVMCSDCRRLAKKHPAPGFEEKALAFRAEIGGVGLEKANREVFYEMVERCAEMGGSARKYWLENHACVENHEHSEASSEATKSAEME